MLYLHKQHSTDMSTCHPSAWPQVTWDEYSANGVNNINAYAWPSHCVKALRSIEAEKIGMSKRRRNVIHSTMSFDLDELLAAAPEAATPGSGGEEGGVQRGSSYDDLNLVKEVRSSNSGSTPFAGSGGAADDMMRSFSMTSPGHHERSQAEQRGECLAAGRMGVLVLLCGWTMQRLAASDSLINWLCTFHIVLV